MPIIIISSELADPDKEIISGTAASLNYQVLGPEFLNDIAADCKIPVETLRDALERTPPVWRWKQSRRWPYYLACIESAVLERLKADHIVCWGLAAHLYVQGVSHALKIHLVSDRAQRIAAVAKEKNISQKRAEKWLNDESRRRQQWSLAAFNQDELKVSLYDMVFKLGQIANDEAVQAITSAAGYRKFKPMTYSIKNLNDIALAARVKIELLASLTDISVQAMDGKVVVTSKALKRERQKKVAMIKDIAAAVQGVEYVEVHLINYIIREAAESYR
jgi:cytidylate kinase